MTKLKRLLLPVLSVGLVLFICGVAFASSVSSVSADVCYSSSVVNLSWLPNIIKDGTNTGYTRSYTATAAYLESAGFGIGPTLDAGFSTVWQSNQFFGRVDRVYADGDCVGCSIVSDSYGFAACTVGGLCSDLGSSPQFWLVNYPPSRHSVLDSAPLWDCSAGCYVLFWAYGNPAGDGSLATYLASNIAITISTVVPCATPTPLPTATSLPTATPPLVSGGYVTPLPGYLPPGYFGGGSFFGYTATPDVSYVTPSGATPTPFVYVYPTVSGSYGVTMPAGVWPTSTPDMSGTVGPAPGGGCGDVLHPCVMITPYVAPTATVALPAPVPPSYSAIGSNTFTAPGIAELKLVEYDFGCPLAGNLQSTGSFQLCIRYIEIVSLWVLGASLPMWPFVGILVLFVVGFVIRQ